MPKLGLISLGCAKNLVDSEHMLSLMRDAGWEITEDMSEADVGVVNTCGFIEAAKTEAIETILETAQYKQTGRMKGLVVTGCLVQRYADEMRRELPEIDVFCGTGSYDNIVDAATAALRGEQAAYMADMTAAALDGGRSRLTPSYTAYFKIAEGCSNTCAYCIIPKLRGRYRSREMASLLEEARALSDAGVKELIVIAQDITKYGMDLPEHKRLLPELLRELCKLDFTWIRLHYLYPDQITDELIDVIAEEPKIVKYLDIPLQHVSKRILRAMHRPGDGAEFTALIEDMRRRIPGLVLRTSLIVGLPGETLSFKNGYTYVSGEKLDESYLPTQGITTLPDSMADKTFTVPEGCMFVMGDNRTGSNDSRLLGEPYIPVEAVQARMLVAISVGSDQSWQGVRWIG